MSIPFVDIFSGISDMTGHLIELYRVRRDGSFFEQQQFMAHLREEEAAQAHKRSLERDALVASQSTDQIEAATKSDLDKQIASAGLEIAVSRIIRSDEINHQNSVFRYEVDKTRSLIESATAGGTRPAFLIAPFYHDHLSDNDNDHGPHSFRVAIRRSWKSKGWHNDVGLLDGLISRPLRNTDTDLMVIQQDLHDLPVILAYGEVQDSTRVWASLSAWNVAFHDGTPAIHVNLPPMYIEPGDEDSGVTSRLAFEDALGDRIALVAGTLAEWFHVVNHGRSPQLHKLAAAQDGFGRRHLAFSTLAAFEVALQKATVSEFAARVEQMTTCLDVGMSEPARDMAVAAYELISSSAEELYRADRPRLRSLSAGLASLGRADLADSTRELLEKRARKEVMDFFALGDSIAEA
ncbi:hypothetical protein [Micromonospora musae]|uniref:hypothetical protein n=1 Tax=Micromonospora musae TaxID=1894970 RepID=UPI0011C37685|nr:hypothetical protein [Micromonospora musae]